MESRTPRLPIFFVSVLAESIEDLRHIGSRGRLLYIVLRSDCCTRVPKHSSSRFESRFGIDECGYGLPEYMWRDLAVTFNILERRPQRSPIVVRPFPRAFARGNTAFVSVGIASTLRRSSTSTANAGRVRIRNPLEVFVCDCLRRPFFLR
jgi:hypothetical protein